MFQKFIYARREATFPGGTGRVGEVGSEILRRLAVWGETLRSTDEEREQWP